MAAIHGYQERNLKIITDSFYGDGDVVLVPAARGDVCIAHVQQVGDQGTVRIDGQRYADVEAMKAADKVIVMAEEIVPEEELRQILLLMYCRYFRVNAIVECPFGGLSR